MEFLDEEDSDLTRSTRSSLTSMVMSSQLLADVNWMLPGRCQLGDAGLLEVVLVDVSEEGFFSAWSGQCTRREVWRRWAP